MKLGVDTFSLRWQGWDAFQILEYAAQQGLDNVHFSERRLFTTLDEDYLASLKRRADGLGLSIEVGMLSFDQYAGAFNPALGSGEEQLMEMVRAARVVGSPVVRCVLGFQADRLGAVPFAQHVDECIRALRAAGPVARDCGVRFAIENHGGVDLLARELKALIEAAGTDIAGACLDTGNPVYGGEDPVLSAEVLGPLIISSHVRDSRGLGGGRRRDGAVGPHGAGAHGHAPRRGHHGGAGPRGAGGPGDHHRRRAKAHPVPGPVLGLLEDVPGRAGAGLRAVRRAGGARGAGAAGTAHPAARARGAAGRGAPGAADGGTSRTARPTASGSSASARGASAVSDGAFGIGW